MTFIPHSLEERRAMLAQIGIDNEDQLFSDIPAEIRLKEALKLPEGMTEPEVIKKLTELSLKNKGADFTTFLGAGAYQHYTPSIVNHLLLRSEFYTAYTPYQPEISQGTLQAIYEYQTLICELTGMDASNASMYDGATAVAEAAVMAVENTRRKKILVSALVHPEYREVLQTYAKARDIEVLTIPEENGITNLESLKELATKESAAVIVQYTNFFGSIEKLNLISEITQGIGALLITAVDPLTLAVLEAPGNLGADIVVGDGQSLGLPLSYGGPYLGFIATKEKYVRRMPGRIVGATVDTKGRRGFVLTLQAREQHIRREKATSNICSNQALCALAATIYLAVLGKKGLKGVAEQCLTNAHYAYAEVNKLSNIEIITKEPFFMEFVIKTKEPLRNVISSLKEQRIIGGLELDEFYPGLENHLLLCFTEIHSKEEIDKLVKVLGGLA